MASMHSLQQSPFSFIQRPQSAKAIMKELVEGPMASEIIKDLPPLFTYHLISEVGLADSMEFLELCSSAQLEACLDLDCWKKDSLVLDRVWVWLEALLELEDYKAAQFIDSLDHEWLVSFLGKEIEVYETQEDTHKPLPQEPKGFFYTTPDTFYVIDILPGEHSSLIEKMLGELYRLDLDKARRILMGVLWDQSAQTDELAYRLHSSRMADMGFYDPYEALSIYKEINYSLLSLEEKSAPTQWANVQLFFPQLIRDALEKTPFLWETLAMLDSATQRSVGWQLLTLGNQALSADGVLGSSEPDTEKQAVLCRTFGYVSLGLDFLLLPNGVISKKMPAFIEGKQTVALTDEFFSEMLKAILSHISVLRIFQTGYTMARKVAKAARLFIRHAFENQTLEKEALSIIHQPYRDIIECLTFKPRPMFSLALDNHRYEGERPFARLADIEKATKSIESLMLIHQFLTVGLGVPAHFLGSVYSPKKFFGAHATYIGVAGTLFCNFLLGRPAAFVPVQIADLPNIYSTLAVKGANGFTLKDCRKEFDLFVAKRLEERDLTAQKNSFWDAIPIQDFINVVVIALVEDLTVVKSYQEQILLGQIDLPKEILATFTGVLAE